MHPAGTKESGQSSRPAMRRGWTVVAAILVLHVAVQLTAVSGKSHSYDEIAHLTAGCTYWKYHDYRFQPENGVLPQLWCALPVMLFVDPRFPSQTQKPWQESDVWAYGDQFFYLMGNDLEGMLWWGRAATSVLSAVLCLVVFLWSRGLFGDRGGFVSLVVAAGCPTMLAHGALVTSDLCTALFFLLSVASVWSLLQRVTLARMLAAALSITGLMLSKYSAVLIVPMAAVMTAVAIVRGGVLEIALPFLRRNVQSRGPRVVATVLVAGGVTVVVWGLVWGVYGWRYSSSPGAHKPLLYRFENLETLAEQTGPAGRVIRFASDHHLLPEAWLYGFLYVYKLKVRAAFLMGEYSKTGWRVFFPFCFLVKTPLPVFALLVLATGGIVGEIRRQRDVSLQTGEGAAAAKPSLLYRLTPLLSLWGVLWPVFIISTLNIGHRHLLPTYPPLYIWAGGTGWQLVQKGRSRWIVLACLAAFVADSARAYPHYIAYFNQIIGSRNAYRYLVDSNLDWGQDLPGLKRWLDEHRRPEEPVYFEYFGNARAEHYGIQAMPLDYPDAPEYAWKPGLYCVSATALSTVYFPVGGKWTTTHERSYEKYGKQVLEIEARKAAGKESGLNPDEEKNVYQTLIWLSIARMMAYLRHRPPDDMVGYSILIYRLTAEDIERARHGPPAELVEL